MGELSLLDLECILMEREEFDIEKDGEKILLMPSNSTATKENTRSDAIEVESNND